ncbi:hypothetical protein HMI55_007335, partial [Coelomomyces lativittatus]
PSSFPPKNNVTFAQIEFKLKQQELHEQLRSVYHCFISEDPNFLHRWKIKSYSRFYQLLATQDYHYQEYVNIRSTLECIGTQPSVYVLHTCLDFSFIFYFSCFSFFSKYIKKS